MTENYGFIITRHVNSEKTNKYWNHCVRCIRRFYPFRRIIIIDDNSNYNFIESHFSYKNITIVQSEYAGRGELLPYYYLYKNRYFANAVILHDSVFFHKRIPFERMRQLAVMPIWHFDYNEDIDNCVRLAGLLKNSESILDKVSATSVQKLGFRQSDIWHGCFGVQSYISLAFLSSLQEKYNLFNLLKVVKNRSDRCSLERILGALFYVESPTLYKTPSLLGNIWVYEKWGYSLEDYSKQYKYIKKPLVKIWTGR